MRAVALTIALSIVVPSVARAEPKDPGVTPHSPRSRLAEVVGAVLAVSGGVVFTYGAGRWLVGALSPDHAHAFDFSSECVESDSRERASCESTRRAEDAEVRSANERDRHGGALAMAFGGAIALTGALVLVAAFAKPSGAPPKATRILPLDTRVQYVPPPGGGGTTILVPAIGGTW